MDSSPKKRAVSLPLIVVYGSVWGLIEMSLGGFLHFVHFPHKGLVLGAMALALMASFVVRTGRPGLVPWLGLIAASYKFLDVIWFGVSPMAPAVVNPATAILLEALVFSVVGAVFARRSTFKALAVRGAPKWK